MDSNVIIAILSMAAVFGFVCLVLHRRYRRTIGKVTFLFNAIDNRDFSFNFPEQGSDRLVNESLNRIRRIIEKARHDLMERDLIARTIHECDGNLSLVAQRLDIARQTLYNKIKKYGL